MQGRKTILLRLPADMVDRLGEIKAIRSRQMGRRVTWAESFDEATEQFIQIAEKVLDEAGVKVGDEYGK